MGMFDSIYIFMKCPNCGLESEIEAQTKQLECLCNNFKLGDHISDQFNYLDCIADCHSEPCLKYSEEKLGYKSGFGRMFYARIFIENGKVNGKYEILKK
jgi:hypothetical protein